MRASTLLTILALMSMAPATVRGQAPDPGQATATPGQTHLGGEPVGHHADRCVQRLLARKG